MSEVPHYGLAVVLGGWAFSYKRGTPENFERAFLALSPSPGPAPQKEYDLRSGNLEPRASVNQTLHLLGPEVERLQSYCCALRA